MADDEAATIKRHRKNGPRYCVRCASRGREVPADWDLKPTGEATMALCDTHARYWAGIHGINTFPGDK